ncbi:hypothetical protein AX16_001306 [Volvariella volvacea WC 439]|nr:hypothetical protein AX16_001306 [Volvariella volvacea WC 439]
MEIAILEIFSAATQFKMQSTSQSVAQLAGLLGIQLPDLGALWAAAPSPSSELEGTPAPNNRFAALTTAS